MRIVRNAASPRVRGVFPEAHLAPNTSAAQRVEHLAQALTNKHRRQYIVHEGIKRPINLQAATLRVMAAADGHPRQAQTLFGLAS